MERRKVIFILVDALGASYFAAQRSRLTYLSAMAEAGLLVESVKPATPGTSRPGRATILTGVSGPEHGVYGNSLFENGAFRPANERDVGRTTIAQLANEAGLDVVGLGFGLLRPDHTALQIDPWWEHRPQKGLSNIKIPSQRQIWNVLHVRYDRDQRLAGLVLPPLSLGQGKSEDARLHPHMIGLANDQFMLQLAGDLACGDNPPDLILTEFSVTDTVQHYHGYDVAATNWVYQTADMAIGLLLHRLTVSGRRDDYMVIVAGDHGQAPVETAIYPEALLPHDAWTTEGASLHVVLRDERERAEVEEHLGALGVRALDGDHLPAAVRAQGLVTFVAPKGSAFERRPEGAPEGARTGEPVIVSTHGLAPGDPGDDAVAIIAGAGAEQGRRRAGDLREIAPIIASALGLDAARLRAAA
jgi:predicted AlkP superfamily pyrophosphatase or phosphodiesterase